MVQNAGKSFDAFPYIVMRNQVCLLPICLAMTIKDCIASIEPVLDKHFPDDASGLNFTFCRVLMMLDPPTQMLWSTLHRKRMC